MSPQCTPMYVGIDLHKQSARVAVLRGWEGDFYDERTLPSDVRKVVRYLKRLSRHGRVVACYEASGAGYVLQRAVARAGMRCEVIAPTLVSRKPGERRKTDKIDARKLARQLRNGELVPIRVPSEPEERVREVVRGRECVRREVHRSRQHILKLLRRRGVVPPASAWTVAFWAWLRKLQLPGPDQRVLDCYIALLDTKLALLADFDEQVDELSKTPALREPVGRLRCLRGIDTLSAMVIVTELGDVRRFGSARALMAYVGLGVAEYSSGDASRRYGIAKTGSTRCRRILVEAAQHYRHRPARSKGLRERQRGQHAAVVAHAWRAQHRLHKRFRHLDDRMPRQKATIAIARELVGFVWAILRAEPELLAQPKLR